MGKNRNKLRTIIVTSLLYCLYSFAIIYFVSTSFVSSVVLLILPVIFNFLLFRDKYKYLTLATLSIIAIGISLFTNANGYEFDKLSLYGCIFLIFIMLSKFKLFQTKAKNEISTEQKKLQIYKRDIDHLFNNFDAMIFILDIESKILDVNDKVCEKLEFPRSQLVGMKLINLFSQKAYLKLAEMLTTGVIDPDFQFYVFSLNGKTLPIEFFSITKAKKEQQIYVCAKENSNYLKYEKQKNLQAISFEKSFHVSPKMKAIIKRESLEIIDINNAFLSKLELIKDEVEGYCFNDFIDLSEDAVKKIYANQSFESDISDESIENLSISGYPFTIQGIGYYLVIAEENIKDTYDPSNTGKIKHELTSLANHYDNHILDMIDNTDEGFCIINFPEDLNNDVNNEEFLYESFKSSNVVYSNRTFLNLFFASSNYMSEITPAKIAGNNYSIWTSILQNVYSNYIWETEQQIETLNEIVKNVNAKYIAQFDEDNRFVGLKIILKDISKIKLLENDLNSSIQLFVRSIDSIADQVYVIDMNFKIKLTNKAASQFCCADGVDDDEIVGKNILDVLEIANNDGERIEEVFNTGKSYWKEETLAYKYQKITVKKQYIPIVKKKSVSKVIIIISEISKDEIAHRALVRIKAQQKALLDNIPHMAWLKDLNGVYISVNEPFAKLHGRTVNETKGKTDFDLIPENLAIKYKNTDEYVLTTKKQKYFEEPVTMGEKTIWLEIIKTPIFNEKNEIIGTTGLALDITERKLSEEALKESEERFRQLTENIKEVFWLVDWNNNEVLYLSSAFESVFGMQEEIVYGRFYDWFDNIHPEDKEAVFNSYVTGAPNGSFDIEYRIIKKDDEIRWIHNKAFPVCDFVGTVWRIAGVADDVTEWKQTQMELEKLNETLEMRVTERTKELQLEISERIQVESALRESEGIFRGYFELGPLGMAITSPETQWLKVNKTLSDMFGYSETELLSSTWTEITHPDDYNDEMIHFLTLLEGQIKGYHLEKRFVHKNGRIVYTMLYVRGVYDDNNKIKSVLMLLQDITETKKTREILDKKLIYEKSLAKCSQILLREDITPEQAINNTLRELLTSTQMNRVCIYENYEDIQDGLSGRLVYEVSTSEAELVLQQIERSIITYNDLSRWQDVMLQRQVLKGLVAELPENEKIYFKSRNVKSFLTIPLMVEGSWEGYVGFEDMTSEREWNRDEVEMLRTASDMIVAYIGRKKIENALEHERASLAKRIAERTKELSAANAQLAQAAKMKDEFLASMSHELRTPLNAILGLSEALVDQVYGPLNEDHTNTLKTIEESGRHLLDLINDILDLSKIDAGKFTLDIADVGVLSLCESSIRFIKQDCVAKNIKINTEYDETVQIIKVDQRRLKQILVNLLSNAVKFTPDNGEISLKIEGDREKQLVKFIVSDSGIGIPESEMVNLFKPFVQLDSSLSRRHGGTGLGLSLARKLVELHGGSIQVESVVNEGSTFSVFMPWVESFMEEQFGQGNGYEESQLLGIDSVVVYSEDGQVSEALAYCFRDLKISDYEIRNSDSDIKDVISDATKWLILCVNKTEDEICKLVNEIHFKPENRDIKVLILSNEKIDTSKMNYGKSLNILMPISNELLQSAFIKLLSAEKSFEETVSFSGVKSMQPAQQKIILLAEDNENNINMIYDYLTAKDYLVVVARNGREAVNLVQESVPNLILMDIQMPEMDGLEATEQIRRNKKFENVPIIALTALAMPGDRERCLASGANDYLTKPVSLKNLMNTINQYIQKEENVHEKG